MLCGVYLSWQKLKKKKTKTGIQSVVTSRDKLGYILRKESEILQIDKNIDGWFVKLLRFFFLNCPGYNVELLRTLWH